MKPYIEKLKTYLAEHPPDYGDCDAHSVLEMLYTYYSQYNRLDTPQIKSDFEELYQQLAGMSLRELDNIIDTVTTPLLAPRKIRLHRRNQTRHPPDNRTGRGIKNSTALLLR